MNTKTTKYIVECAPIPSLKEKDLPDLLKKARVRIKPEYSVWGEAQAAAVEASAVGGIAWAAVITIRTERSRTARFENEKLVEKFGKPVTYTTKKELKKL